jgi:hypothetical protein
MGFGDEPKNYYEILRVASNADAAAIKKAYRKRGENAADRDTSGVSRADAF